MDLIICGTLLGAGLFMVIAPRSSPRVSRVRAWCDEAGLAGVPLPLILLVGVTVAIIVGSIAATLVPIPVIAPLGGIVGAGIPIVALAATRDARRTKARAVWPDFIDSIRGSLRSGSTLAEAVTSASVMVPRDWKASWSQLEKDLRRGSDVDTALRRLQRALADSVADRVVEAICIAREFGGSELPHVLTDLARSVRREQSMRDEVHARQSWVRHAATLGVVAPWIVLALLSSRPENREAYSSAPGTILIIASAGATVIAYFVMSALGAVRDKPRWLTGALDD
jgi:tight adherence protein B